MDEYLCPSIDDQASESAITEEQLEQNFRRIRNVLSPDQKVTGYINNCDDPQSLFGEVFAESPEQKVPSMDMTSTAETRRRVFSSSSKIETIDDNELFGDGQPNHESHPSVNSLPDVVASSPEMTPNCLKYPNSSPDVVGLNTQNTRNKKFKMKENFEGKSYHPDHNSVQRSVSFDKNVSLTSSVEGKRRDYSSGYATGESDEKESKASSIKSQFSNTSSHSVFNESCTADQIVPECAETDRRMKEIKSDSDSTVCSVNSSAEENQSWESSINQKKISPLSDADDTSMSQVTLMESIIPTSNILPHLSLLSKEQSEPSKPPETPFLSIFNSDKQPIERSGNEEYFFPQVDDESVILPENPLSQTADENRSKSQTSIIDKSEHEFVMANYLKKNSPEQSPHPNLIARDQELLEEKLTTSAAPVQTFPRVLINPRATKPSVSYRSLAAQSCLQELKDRLVISERSDSDSFSDVNGLLNLYTCIQDHKSSSSPHYSDEDSASPGKSCPPIDLNFEKCPLSRELSDVEHLQKVKRYIEQAARCEFNHCKDKDCLKGKQEIEMLEKSLQGKEIFSKELNDVIWGLRFHAEDCEEFDGKCSVPWCSFFQQHVEHTHKNQDLFLCMKEKIRGTQTDFINLRESQKFEMLQNSRHGKLNIMTLCYLGSHEKTVLAKCETSGYIVIKKTPRNYFDEGIAGEFHPIQVLKKLHNHNHPNIVHILWYSLHEKDLFTCTALYTDPGIPHQRKLKWNDIQSIMKCIISAVVFLHKQGIVYLNWEAKNILFDGSIHNLKLSNFTAAVSLDQPENIDFGALKYILRPHLIPPELSSCPPNLCHKSDVYGIGCVLHELLNGKHVWWKFRHMDRTSLSGKISGELPNISKDLSASRKMIFDRSWKINPDDRPDVEELKTLIENCR